MTGYNVGIDYGGTMVKVIATLDGTDDPIRTVFDTVTSGDADDALRGLAEQVSALLGDAPLHSVGVTVPGVVDEDSGIVHRSVNLPWLDGVDLNSTLEKLLVVPVRAIHDGRAAALAEALNGAGVGFGDVSVVALGTGVASAHVRDGVVLQGAHGAAGEIGHISQDPTAGRRCSCGQRGCLETFIGGTALAAAWSEATESRSTARALIDAAESGDRMALRIVDGATTALARGLLGLVATVDPGAIILGGGIGGRDIVLSHVREKLVASATFHQIPPVLAAELGMWAGAWGALRAGSAAAGRA